MAQKSLSEILTEAAANKEVMEIPYENLPEERGQWKAVPQPGSYRFEVPASIDSAVELVEARDFDTDGNPKKDAEGKEVKLQRVQLNFSKDKALKIVQSKNGRYDGEDFQTRISNVERLRSAGKGVKVKVSDMTYLLRAKAPTAQPRTNVEFINTCLQTLPGQSFGANIEWQGSCGKDKDAYFAFENPEKPGEYQYETMPVEGGAPGENKKGCGERVYQKDWPKDQSGEYLERMQCKCGAMLRPFAQLSQFKP